MASPTKPRRFPYGKHPSQYVLVRHPEKPAPSGKYPLAIILHGGFWKGKYGLDPPTSAIETISPALLSRGFMTAEVEYRRSGDAHWGYQYTDADVAAAYAACLALWEADSSRVVVLGHSAGGMLALSLLFGGSGAVQVRPLPPPALILALAPVADLCRAAELGLSDDGDAVQQYMRGEPAERREEYALACPACRVDEIVNHRVVLVTGIEDKEVPSAYVRELFEKAKKEQKTFVTKSWEYVELENADHFDVVNAGSTAWRLILPFIENAVNAGSPLPAASVAE